jgi:hypothetical protein
MKSSTYSGITQYNQMFHVVILLGSLFDSGDGGGMFLRNVDFFYGAYVVDSQNRPLHNLTNLNLWLIMDQVEDNAF